MAWKSPLVLGSDGRPQQLQAADSLIGGGLGMPPGGRLTTESGVAVSTSDRTAQSSLIYTPYVSDYLRLYDGTRVKEYVFTERSLTLTGLLTSGNNYDAFLYDNAGTITFDISAAWTNDTTRADALAWQSGLGWVKSGAPTRLWVGTFRATGTGTTEDSGLTANAGGATPKRFVWNAWNRVPRIFRRNDTTSSWTYNSTTWRAARGSNSNRIELVCGLSGQMINAQVVAYANIVSTGDVGRIALAEDSTTTPHANCLGMGMPNTVNSLATLCVMKTQPTVGYHYYQWIERSWGVGNGMVFYGNDGFAVCGIDATWEC